MREVLVNLPGGGSHWFDIPDQEREIMDRGCCAWSEIEDRALLALAPSVGRLQASWWHGRTIEAITARCGKLGIHAKRFGGKGRPDTRGGVA